MRYRELRVFGGLDERGTTVVHTATVARLILSAGTIGSTYLLLRNWSVFPRVSKLLGTRFCGNGDLLTFAVKTCEESGGKRVPRVIDPAHEPVITSAARVGGERGFYLEDAGFPEHITCLLVGSSRETKIDRQILLQPVVDLTLSFPSIDKPASECLVTREDLAWYYEQYYGAAKDTRDPRVSSIFADDLSGLPPVLTIAAEYDTLLDEARVYADRLGSESRYTCCDGMIHGSLQMAGLVDDAQAAIDEIARTVSSNEALFPRPGSESG